MLGKRDRGELVRPSPDENHLDGLARGVADGTVTRGRAIKLAGAALAASALTLFAGQEEADAVTARRRRRCRRRFDGNGVICSGRGRTVCCNDATTSARRCSRGRCGTA
jgi:hypothetical protein